MKLGNIGVDQLDIMSTNLFTGMKRNSEIRFIFLPNSLNINWNYNEKRNNERFWAICWNLLSDIKYKVIPKIYICISDTSIEFAEKLSPDNIIYDIKRNGNDHRAGGAHHASETKRPRTAKALILQQLLHDIITKLSVRACPQPLRNPCTACMMNKMYKYIYILKFRLYASTLLASRC